LQVKALTPKPYILLQVKLAVSLHAASDEERNAIMPVNVRWPLRDLMSACDEYVRLTGRRITFEWALIAGQNDTPEVAHKLGKLLSSLNKSCHVNLIPLNPTAGFDGAPTKAADCKVFVDILAEYGVAATPRVRRGIDIDAVSLPPSLPPSLSPSLFPFFSAPRSPGVSLSLCTDTNALDRFGHNTRTPLKI
jgi:hypothetical protein